MIVVDYHNYQYRTETTDYEIQTRTRTDTTSSYGCNCTSTFCECCGGYGNDEYWVKTEVSQERKVEVVDFVDEFLKRELLPNIPKSKTKSLNTPNRIQKWLRRAYAR
jgi:ubiquinone/menaquinone biosynthesis C-methylase UbiE